MCDTEVIETKLCGKIKVFLQGPRNLKVALFTIHDLGCNHNEMINFVGHDHMEQLRTRCSWVHVCIPGQGDSEEDLPADYVFPTMQQLAEAMGEVCDALGLAHVVVFGEGAGANILARLAMIREDLVLGAILIHCTGTAAGVAETLKDKIIGWKLNTVGMNATTESYLLLHRFGTTTLPKSEMELKRCLESFRQSLRQSINPRNLNKFIVSFMSRTKIIEKVEQLKCPVLFLTGALASHNHTIHRLYDALLNFSKGDMARRKHIDLIEMEGVANVLRSRPDRVAECLQNFIQGLGLGSTLINRRLSCIMQTPVRGRSLSMEEYDQPKGVSACVFDKHRKYSTALVEGDDLMDH